MHIFGYGSLINTASASKALGRKINLQDITPARLHGYKRTWSLTEKVYSKQLERVITGVFLDILSTSGGCINGVLIPIKKDEMRSLIAREKNYDPIDVSKAIQLSDEDVNFDKVITFISDKAHRFSQENKANVYVLKKYAEMVTSACSRLGKNFLLEYEKTTESIPFEVIEGDYTFTDPEQAKYV